MIFLQQNIDTVTVEKVENGEEDCIKMKTEEDYIEELVQTVKSEEEVSVFVGVFFGSYLVTGVCACVLYCTLYLVTHSCHMCISHLFNLCL